MVKLDLFGKTIFWLVAMVTSALVLIALYLALGSYGAVGVSGGLIASYFMITEPQ